MIRITQPMLSQCIRLLTVHSQGQSPDRPLFLKLLRSFEERYGFLQAPRTLADYDINAGITFLEGQYTDTLISKFTVSSNGILAEANAPTDDIDRFLDDVISWANRELGRREFEEQITRRAYLSQLEVQIDLSLSRAFSEFLQIGARIAETVRTYGQNTQEFELSNIALHSDLTNVELPKPGVA